MVVVCIGLVIWVIVLHLRLVTSAARLQTHDELRKREAEWEAKVRTVAGEWCDNDPYTGRPLVSGEGLAASHEFITLRTVYDYVARLQDLRKVSSRFHGSPIDTAIRFGEHLGRVWKCTDSLHELYEKYCQHERSGSSPHCEACRHQPLGHVLRIVKGRATPADVERYRENAESGKASERRHEELVAMLAARQAGHEPRG